VTDELRQHWVLHETDEEAARHEAERAKLPEQLRVLDARVTSERRKVDDLASRAAALEKRRRELERDIAAFEAQEKRFRAQLDAVTDQKQFVAVQHEIAGVAGKRSTLETEALTLMDEEERIASARPAAAEALAKAERETAAARETIDASQARLDAVIAALDARRAEVSAGLSAGARTRYERARALRGGRGVAELLEPGLGSTNGTCGGCHAALTPRLLQEARRREALVACEACGRLLLLRPEDLPGA